MVNQASALLPLVDDEHRRHTQTVSVIVQRCVTKLSVKYFQRLETIFYDAHRSACRGSNCGHRIADRLGFTDAVAHPSWHHVHSTQNSCWQLRLVQ